MLTPAKLALLIAAAGIPTPAPPTLDAPCPPPTITKVIETNPVIYAEAGSNDDQPGRVLLPNGTAEYTFISVSECGAPALEPMEPEPADVFADPPPVDPEFDEHGDGPQEGPPGAPTVDHPEP